ncbi:hypothetical protein [Aureispira sp. CCB-E]|uniref:hypothetical protein n=1 Tax=Aureispira sp. CCB-E TaxID=3051121 RepID=UPI0028686E4D|nr:hypothetical protein [Aureispira sp. CCB-E]WMX17571.1 hypothetical protein QP953_28545 [Aureispira sp. CCB-E]
MNEEQKIEIGNSLYIMLSTQNQMVNYIPLKYFGFQNILNITTDDDKNENWDKNFQKVLEEELPFISFKYKELTNIENLKERLSDNETIENASSIFWNITGGQRPFVLAVYDLVKELEDKTHYLCYLEGNSGQMQIMKFEKGIQDIQNFDGNNLDYKLNENELNLKIALQLMGYNIPKLPQNLQKGGFDEEKEFYNKFYPIYKEHPSIPVSLTKSNQNGSDLDVIIDELNLPQTSSLTKEEIKIFWSKYKNKKSFGYILEDMAICLLLKAIEKNPIIKSQLIGLYASTKINHMSHTSNEIIDEFDIIILTKHGQILNFECKSGKMTGDVAKSTNYSTYAISGVYGLPILITPMVKEDSNKINDKITKAIAAAERAKLPVWHLNEIANKLKEHLNNNHV